MPDAESGRLPLTSLAVGEHLHGVLRIAIDGRELPHLGYSGASDVCFDTWLDELGAVETSSGDHTFDELEQGQPAFRFRREGDRLLISIVDSSGDGRGDPDFIDVPCGWSEFTAALAQFRSRLRERLLSEIQQEGRAWLDAHALARES